MRTRVRKAFDFEAVIKTVIATVGFAGWTICVHFKPHLDEIVALWVFVRFGTKKFSKIKGYSPQLFKENRRAFWTRILENVEFWEKGGITPDDAPWEEHIREGKVLFGCATGSPFDEHASDGRAAVKRQCTATLLAEILGKTVRKAPVVKGILRDTLRDDTRGAVSTLELGSIIKAQYRCLRKDDGRKKQIPIIVDALMKLDSLHSANNGFAPARKFLEEDKNIIRQPIQFDGKEIFLVAAQTDLSQFMSAARAGTHNGNGSRKKTRADIVVQQFTTGHINVMVSKSLFSIDTVLAGTLMEGVLAKLGQDASSKGDEEDVKNCLVSLLGQMTRDKGKKAKVDLAMGSLISELRSWEADNRWDEVLPEHLECEGSVPEAREWFWYKPLAGIYNKSETAPGLPATAMSLQQVVSVVVKAFKG